MLGNRILWNHTKLSKIKYDCFYIEILDVFDPLDVFKTINYTVFDEIEHDWCIFRYKTLYADISWVCQDSESLVKDHLFTKKQNQVHKSYIKYEQEKDWSLINYTII